VSASERSKGARGENEVCQIIRACGWSRAHRNFASGAQGGGDIARGPEGVWIECKRTERLRLRTVWRQLEKDAAAVGDMPVLATRWNGGRWLAVVELDELLELLALRERG